ncbi:MAG: ABC transporter permease [Bacteroidia bacterium]|nr:ABC transporter permease [Bacteroidia bacterium]
MSFYLTAVVLALAFGGLSFGIFFSMKIFNIPDITTDGSFTLGGALTGILLLSGISPVLTLILSLVAGFSSGFLTGFIHTRLKVNPLLAGILVMTALYSVNLKSMGKSNLALVDVATLFGNSNLSETWFQVVILSALVMVLILALFFLLKTDFGIAMRATGNSAEMVKAYGVNSDTMKMIGLGIANSLVALSGNLVTQVQGFADINMGVGIVIAGLGSVIIGETLFSFLGIGSLLVRLIFIFIGTLIFRLIMAFVLSQGIDPVWLKLVTALMVLLVVAFPIRSKTA